MSSVTGSARTKPQLAVHHLSSAAMLARNVGIIEQAHAGELIGPAFYEVMWNVSAALMMSVAALEANFNEITSDVDDRQWEIRSRSLLLKHNDYLEFRGLELLEISGKPEPDVALLVELRNKLVHFKPEWEDSKAKHQGITDRVSDRFDFTKFRGKEKRFPFGIMSHDCASWAVKTVWDFGDEFAVRVGWNPRFAKWARQLRCV